MNLLDQLRPESEQVIVSEDLANDLVFFQDDLVILLQSNVPNPSDVPFAPSPKMMSPSSDDFLTVVFEHRAQKKRKTSKSNPFSLPGDNIPHF